FHRVVANADLTFGNADYLLLVNANSAHNIAMAGTSNGIRFNDGNASLTLTGTLHGFGMTYNNGGGGTLVDNGTISADSAGNTLAINNTNLTGSGVLEAKNGGILSIGAVINGGGLKVNVDNNPNSIVEINGGGVTGTLGTSTGTGLSFAANGSNYISNATIASDLTFGQGGYALVYNANSVSGNINMASTSNGIRFNDSNASLTLTGTLHGFGITYNNGGGGTLVNNGIVAGDVSGQTLYLETTNLGGNGVYEGISGGTLSIGGQLNGNNAVVHADSGTVIVDGGSLTGSFAAATGAGFSFAANGNNYLSNATINGNLTFSGGAYALLFNANTVNGTINMTGTSNGIRFNDGNASLTLGPTAKLHGYGATFNNGGGGRLINNGTIAADAPGQTLALNNTFITNNASVAVVAAATLSVGGIITQNSGETKVDGSLNLANTYQINGGILSGTGMIAGNIDNVAGAERAGDSPGILTIAGNYMQEHAATFEELLGGATPGSGYSQLVVSNLATLDGTLDVSLVNGFKPTVGEQFDVLLGANTGSFPFNTSPDPGFTYSVAYLPDRVRITVDTVPVPEPSSLALLLAAVALIAFRRRRFIRVSPSPSGRGLG
ncbi:MAG TPA: PEP-CTERM sorting domain-containing protein, partial [Pirellulales bacterium]|nr:PEP-CTERM sorting domain-containing protein [Pirellulales bacterium]